MPTFNLGNVDLFYNERGQGEPLLFLGGLGGDHLYWLGQMRAFGRDYHCLAPDNRDAGKSSPATGPYSLRTLAEDLAALLRHLRLPPANIVGLSMGGAIAQELALANPGLVQSLVLVSTWARSDEWFRTLLQAFELIRLQVPDTNAFFQAVLPWWVSHHFFEDSGRISWLRWLLRQTPPAQGRESFLRQLAALHEHDTLDRLVGLRCPVLILAGEDDTIAPSRYSRDIQQRITHAQLLVIPEVGHALPLENPGLFHHHIDSFLKESKTPRRRSA